jgi:SAM-dependent MidA family methyltransferase
MPRDASLADAIRNMLKDSDLPFRDFVEVALYHPEFGYYMRAAGSGRDYTTSPQLSPVFAFSLSLLVAEFVGKAGDGMCSIVDIGCGDGSLIHSLYEGATPELRERVRFFGVDRSIDRVPRERRAGVSFLTDLTRAPRGDAQLVISNELFDALPFARLVMRDEHLHELWVTEREGALDWSEHEAEAKYEEYFVERGIELSDGQFVDVSLDWEPQYEEICRFVTRGLVVTFDYGYPGQQLFAGRVRRFGTAAAYRRQRVSRDLLADPGEQDLTAHINFTDLQRAGERSGLSSLFFDRQAKFLLALGATEHGLFAPIDAMRFDSLEEAITLREQREQARRLVLPDGIGEDIRVLVEGRGMGEGGWSFQKKLF